jgi:DNA polymerase III sliding clamp (beta) subunit (PCNA family)
LARRGGRLQPRFLKTLTAKLNRQAFCRALQILRVVAQPGGLSPAGQQVLISTAAEEIGRSEYITFSADNGEDFCRINLAATVEGAGAVAINAERLARLLGFAEGETVTITYGADDQAAALNCAGVKARLPAFDLAALPPRKEFSPAAEFRAPAPDFCAAVARVAEAWAGADGNYAASGNHYASVHLLGDGERMKIEATDGRALHAVVMPCGARLDCMASRTLVGMLAQAETAAVELTLLISRNALQVAAAGTLFQCSLLEGGFPDTAPLLPPPSPDLIRLPRAALLRATQVCRSVMDAAVAEILSVDVRRDYTVLSAYGSGLGDAREMLETPRNTETEFKVDPARLLAALKHCAGEEVAIQCDDPRRCIFVRDGNFTGLIATMMPPPPPAGQ